MLRKQEPKKQRFALRKLTVGVASVLIGFTFMGVSASADSDVPATQTGDQSAVVTPNNDTSANSGSTVKLGKSDAASQGNQAEQQPATSQSATQTSDQSVSDQTKKSEEANTLTLSGQSAMPATALNESKAVTGQTVEVGDLQSFTSALANKNVSQITLTNNIDFNGNQTALVSGGTGFIGANLLKPYELAANKIENIFNKSPYKGIAHDVVIDGTNANGENYSLNMGKWFISLWSQNYDGADKGWNITFKNLNINQENTSYSPIFFGNASADNQKKSSLTFENVKANVAESLNSYEGDNVAIHFVGDNSVTVANMARGVNAVNGSTVDFTKSTDTNSTNTTTFTINGDIKGSENSGNWANAAIFASSTGKKAVNIAKGATVNINSKSADFRGITAGRIGIIGDQGAEVYVAGKLNEDLANGHGTAIWAGNLTIDSGNVTINTMQDNQADGTEDGWVNGVTNYNGYHFAPISLGVGSKAAMQDSNAALTINNAGELHVIRGNVYTLVPLISYGTGGAHNNSKFGLTVGQDGTDVVLDLQDGASTPSTFHGYPWDTTGAYLGAKNDIFWPGMIHMFGAGCTANLSFGDVKYVNLQRTGNQRGFLIALEGKNNQASINASNVPLAQWMGNNTTDVPDHAWLVNDLITQNEMGNWDANFVPANGQPKINPSTSERNKLFGQSNGQVTMSPIMAGDGSARYNNGHTYGPASADQGLTGQRSSYLQNFMDNFNWWTPRRISFGHLYDGNPDIIKIADQYQPKVQTINTNTQKTINDLNVKDGIEGFYDKNLNLIPKDQFDKVDWTKSQFGIDWSKTPWSGANWMVNLGTKLTDDQINAAVNAITNSDSDQQNFDRMNVKNAITAYNAFIDSIMHAQTNSNGTLAQVNAYKADGKTLNNAETATIVYTDGSADFVNIPINVTKETIADQAVEVGLANSTWDGYRELTVVKDSNGKIHNYQLDYHADKKVPLSHVYQAKDFVKSHDSEDDLYEGVEYKFDDDTQKLLDNNDDHTILAANNGNHYVNLGIIATYKDGSTKHLSGRLTILELPVFKPIYTKFGLLPTPDISWVQNAGNADTPWLVQSVGHDYSKKPVVDDPELGYSEYHVPVYYGATDGELDKDGKLINAHMSAPHWDFMDGMYIINPQSESHYKFVGDPDNFKTLTSATISQVSGAAELTFNTNGQEEHVRDDDGEVSFGDYLDALKYEGLFNSLPDQTTIQGTWDNSDHSKAGIYNLTYHFNYGKQGNTQVANSNGSAFDMNGNTKYGLVDGIFNGFTPDADGNYTQDVTAQLYVLNLPQGGTIKIHHGDSTVFTNIEKQFGDKQLVTNLDPDNVLNPQSIDKTAGWLDGQPSNQESSDHQLETIYNLPINGGIKVKKEATVHVLVVTLDADKYNPQGEAMWAFSDDFAHGLNKLTTDQDGVDLRHTGLRFRNGFLRTGDGVDSIYDIAKALRQQNPNYVLKFKWDLPQYGKSGFTLGKRQANVTIIYPDGSTDVTPMEVLVLQEPSFVRYNQCRPEKGAKPVTIDAHELISNLGTAAGKPVGIQWASGQGPEITADTSLGVYPEDNAWVKVQYSDAGLHLVGWPKDGQFNYSVPTIFVTNHLQTVITKGDKGVAAIEENLTDKKIQSVMTLFNDGEKQIFTAQGDNTMSDQNGHVLGQLSTNQVSLSRLNRLDLHQLVDLDAFNTADYQLTWAKQPITNQQKLKGMIRAEFAPSMFIDIPVDAKLVEDQPTGSASSNVASEVASSASSAASEATSSVNSSATSEPASSANSSAAHEAASSTSYSDEPQSIVINNDNTEASDVSASGNIAQAASEQGRYDITHSVTSHGVVTHVSDNM